MLDVFIVSNNAIDRVDITQPEVTKTNGRAETRQCGPPPEIIFRGPLKIFLDGDAKEQAPKGRCQAWGVWGHPLPENFAEFDLILEVFGAF